MEEEHADVLADHTIQGGGRAGHTAQAGQLQDRARQDAEERSVEYWYYAWSGIVIKKIIIISKW